MNDPKSIKVVKVIPTFAEILEALLIPGASIRSVTAELKTHTKRVHMCRQANADRFPKKEKKFYTPKLPRPKNVKRWLTVPKDVDEKICMEARKKNMTWQDFINEVLRDRFCKKHLVQILEDGGFDVLISTKKGEYRNIRAVKEIKSKLKKVFDSESWRRVTDK